MKNRFYALFLVLAAVFNLNAEQLKIHWPFGTNLKGADENVVKDASTASIMVGDVAMPFLFSSTMVKGSNIEWNDATVMYPDGNTTDGISLCKTTNNGETTNSPEDAITFVATPVQGVVFNPKKVSVSVAFNATSTNFSYDILLEQGDKSVLLGNIPGTGPKQKRIDMTYDITDAMGFSQSDEVLKVLVRLSYPWGNLKTFLGNVTIEGDAVLPAMDMYTITTGVAPENSGSVNPATVYTINGWETKFTAEPAEKHFFKHWESNGVVISTENPLFKDDFSSDMQLTAVFDRLAEYTLNWNIEGDASNKVTVTTDKELSGNSAVLDNNTSVRFTAIAADGYEFRGWMDASREIISYNNPYTFAIGENTSVTALFAKLGADQAPAFPTAEGFGKWATGGRGGKVVTVTNLEDDAAGSIEGSFRWALKQYPGEPLTVVFNVSGIIDFKGHDLRSNRSNVTIAGQTAPGDGICFKGGCLNFGGSRNLIIRHIRSRLGLLNETDFIEGASINIENGGNFIIDHCSFSWSAEEVVNVYDNDNTTIQWCVISEGLYSAGHGKGDRAYAAVLGGRSASYHHNLLAHNNNRTPRFGCTTPNDMIVLIDYVNNVNYNWGKSTSCYGGDNRHGDESLFQLNMINNYYKPGPAYPGTSRTWFVRPSYHANTGTSYGKWHLNGNFIEGSANALQNEDNNKGFYLNEYTAVMPDFTADMLISDYIPVRESVITETAAEAYNSVLAGAGAYPLDAVDIRVIDEVRNGTAKAYASSGKYGIVDKPEDSGGYPEYKMGEAWIDSDGDGMPDAWEIANGLNPNNPEDRNIVLKSGYTVLEAYLASLAGEEIALEFDNDSKIFDFIVDINGKGDFTSINEAINAVPDGITRYDIFVRNGYYNEKVYLGSHSVSIDKTISIIGESMEGVVISWDDYNGKSIFYYKDQVETISGTPQSATLTVNAPDFYMENVTIENPSRNAQAVALYTLGDGAIFKNCHIKGFQDTQYLKKGRRYFFYNCIIEGGTDFICADGTAYYYQCELVSLIGGSYITAPKDVDYTDVMSNGQTLYYGFFFNDCDLTAEPGLGDNKVYLGRPWASKSGSIFMNSRLGSHIQERGWNPWNGSESNTCMGEYMNMNADGTELIDTSKRISWSFQMPQEDYYKYMTLNNIFSKVSNNTFNPIPMSVSPDPVQNLIAEAGLLVWSAAAGAKGYAVYADDVVIGFSKGNSFRDENIYETAPVYDVRSIGAHGNMSEPAGSGAPVSADELNRALNPSLDTSVSQIVNDIFSIRKDYLESASPVNVQVYDLYGRMIESANNVTYYSFSNLQNSIFILRVISEEGETRSVKIRR